MSSKVLTQISMNRFLSFFYRLTSNSDRLRSQSIEHPSYIKFNNNLLLKKLKINALTVQIPRHNTFLLLTLDTSCYPVGTHKHDRHLELHNANDTTLNKETTHSKAVINFKKLLKLLYNTSRMKQVLMLRYKSTKCSKHYEYTNGKKGSQFTT